MDNATKELIKEHRDILHIIRNNACGKLFLKRFLPIILNHFEKERYTIYPELYKLSETNEQVLKARVELNTFLLLVNKVSDTLINYDDKNELLSVYKLLRERFKYEEEILFKTLTSRNNKIF